MSRIVHTMDLSKECHKGPIHLMKKVEEFILIAHLSSAVCVCVRVWRFSDYPVPAVRTQCWLVGLRSASLRDAGRPASFRRWRRRGALRCHHGSQRILPQVTLQGGQRDLQGRTLTVRLISTPFHSFGFSFFASGPAATDEGAHQTARLHAHGGRGHPHASVLPAYRLVENRSQGGAAALQAENRS